VYDAKGYYEPNAAGAYSLNKRHSEERRGRTIEVQFGGCDTKTVNCLPITAGMNT